MSIQHHGRFKDASWYPKKDAYVLIGGAGGIGSWLSLLLCRAGFKIVLYDHDIVEEHNLGGQIFSVSSIGERKVDAVAKIIKTLCGEEGNFYYPEMITSTSPTNDFVVAAFDNMKARKDLFNSWADKYARDPNALFIDGRLQAEHMQIICLRGGDEMSIQQYMVSYLFEDSEVEDAPCTMKQTSHAAAMIASHITGFFTNHIANILDGSSDRQVPFYWEYYIPLDYSKVESETKTFPV